jgi:hypothetical protein
MRFLFLSSRHSSQPTRNPIGSSSGCRCRADRLERCRMSTLGTKQCRSRSSGTPFSLRATRRFRQRHLGSLRDQRQFRLRHSWRSPWGDRARHGVAAAPLRSVLCPRRTRDTPDLARETHLALRCLALPARFVDACLQNLAIHVELSSVAPTSKLTTFRATLQHWAAATPM